MSTESEREIVALHRVESEILFIFRAQMGDSTEMNPRLSDGSILVSDDPEIEIVAVNCDSPEDALLIYEQLGRQLGFVAHPSHSSD